MRTTISRFFSTTVLVLLAAFTGMALAAWSTRQGPGVGGDATIYLTSAKNLAQGIGLGLIQPDGSFRLLPYSAPLFPMVLVPFSLAEADLTQVARWMNIQLFGLLIFGVGWISSRLTGGNRMAAAPAWLLAVSPILLPVYSWAMAEPLTLALGFGGLVFMILRLRRESDTGLLGAAAAGLVFGLASSARYSAAAFLLTGLVMCLIWGKGAIEKRLLQAIVVGLAGALPPGVWVLMQVYQTSGISSRSFLTVSQMGERVSNFWPQLCSAVLVWLLPASVQEAAWFSTEIGLGIIVLVLLIFITVSFWMFRKNHRDSSFVLVASLLLFSFMYLLVILGVYLTTYPPITIDNRMLSPLHVSIIWILGMLLIEIRKRTSIKFLMVSLNLIVIFVCGYFGLRTFRIVQQNADTGLGYNAISWKESPLIATIKVIGDDKKIITNEPMAVLYLTGKIASPIAELYSENPVQKFTRYGDGPRGQDKAEEEFHRGTGILVLFDTLQGQLEPLYGEKAVERGIALVDGLDVMVKSNDGVILLYPSN